MKRCAWCDENSDIYTLYHDKQWGVPVHNDILLFEMLSLEGMQAGLSWITILKKRDNYFKAFDGFDFNIIAKYNTAKIEELMQNSGIIRNRLKINSIINNANSYINIINEFKSFDKYIWAFVNNVPIKNKFEDLSQLPAKTELSEIISKDLKKRGMKFIGPVIIYSFMQAIGMVNDHTTNCFRYNQV